MNELTFGRVFAPGNFGARLFGTKSSRQGSAFYGYSLIIIALECGWLLRDRGIVNPEEGVGYWLGIVGGVMMLALLLYPIRKRVKILRAIGTTAGWFRTHMILGLIGPLLVLYHANFQIGSFNSQIALYCMLIVAGSGIVGRHFYAQVHRGLYGRKTSLAELSDDLKISLEGSDGLAALMPVLVSRMQAVMAELQGNQLTGSIGISASFRWKLRRYSLWFSLSRLARRELKARAAESPAVARDFDRLRKASSSYIRNFVGLVSKIAQFTLFEKLLSIWHLLHMPLFFMLIISALLHVLAVHMY